VKDRLMSAVGRMLDVLNENGTMRLSELERTFSKSLVKYAENRGYVTTTPLRRGDFLVMPGRSMKIGTRRDR
jgi:hypothetical protein